MSVSAAIVDTTADDIDAYTDDDVVNASAAFEADDAELGPSMSHSQAIESALPSNCLHRLKLDGRATHNRHHQATQRLGTIRYTSIMCRKLNSSSRNFYQSFLLYKKQRSKKKSSETCCFKMFNA